MIEIKDLGFGVIEIFDKDTQYAPAQSIKIGNNTYIREDLINKQIADLQKQLEEKEKEIRQLDNEKGTLLNNSMKLLKEKDDKLHDLPKKIIGDVADELGYCGKAYLECEPYIKICIVKSILQAILKKYGDKNESNND